MSWRGEGGAERVGCGGVGCLFSRGVVRVEVIASREIRSGARVERAPTMVAA